MVSSTIYEITAGDEKNFPQKSAQHPKYGQYKGVNPQRSYTDIAFLILIILSWVAMSVIGALAVQKGDPWRLVYPMDASGSLCGYSPSVKNAAKFYTISTEGLGVCTPTCPKTGLPYTFSSYKDYLTLAAVPGSTYNSDPKWWVCLDYVYDKMFPGLKDDTSTLYPFAKSAWVNYISSKCLTGGYYTPRSGCYCNLRFNSSPVFNRCVFSDAAQLLNSYSTPFVPDYISQFFGDIITARYIIFAFGFLLACLVSFVYSHLLRYEMVGRFIVWSSIVVIEGFMVAMVIVCSRLQYQWSQQVPPLHTQMQQYALMALSVFLLVIASLFLVACVFLYKSINLAIKVIALAATCMEYMPLIAATPLLHLFAYGVFMIPFVWYNMYFASEGSMDPVKLAYTKSGDSGLGQTDQDGTYLVGYLYSNSHQWAGGKIWYLFFVLLWTMNFIAGIGSLVIAYATATWYFTPVPERSKITSCTVLDSYGVILRYHTGTAALGALLIAFIQFLRWMLTYIEHNIVQGKGNGADNTVNCLRKSVICLLTCCLWCLEKVIKFISKQAYIQTAIHSEPFLKGAINAFYTIARNIFSVGGVQVISGMAIVIGKIFVSAICGVSAFYIFASGWLKLQNQMKDIIAPTFLVLLIAYITASLIFEVFHMIVDTMIMCYITDAEQNDGIPQFADQTLSEFLADHGTLNMDHIPVNQTGMEMKDLKAEMAKPPAPAPIQIGGATAVVV